MDEDDERAIELSSIAAIFPELEVDESKAFHATLDVPVAPEKPLKIYFQSSTQAAPLGLLTPPTTDGSQSDSVSKAPAGPIAAALNVDVHQLSHLPPLKLYINLPDGYPQEKPPNVTVRADPLWLPQKTLDRIQNQCIASWEDCGRDQVVYTFIDYVQQEAEKAFGLANDGDHKFELSSDLKLVLLDYDLKRKREQFENETFDCGICLEPKKGRICHRLLLCGHVFCVACLQDFYNSCIDEGDIDSVKCLDPGCGKEITHETSPGKRRKIDKTLNPSELLQIPIEQELVQRYVRLKRKKRLESDKNTIYCPRQWCQGAAKSKKHPKSDDPLHDIEEDSADEVDQNTKVTKNKKKSDPNSIPMAERLAVCEDCNYAFCSVCKKGWHGELANCNPRRQAELNEEEKASIEYMKRFSTPCPTCDAPTQKAMGCNHIICFKCKTHFCYLCSAYLMPENPYRHFNDLKSTCYMRLWELEGGDGADVGMGFGGGNAVPWEAEFEDDDSEEEEDDLPPENNEAFAGNDIVQWDDEDDTDDEDPAPDQRRPDRPQIEIVVNGVNRRIEVPGPPPPAPNPPANRRGRGNQRQRNARRRPVPAVNVAHAPVVAAAPAPALAPVIPVQEANEQPAQVLAAPGQGNNVNNGLQNFLRLALEDREDEWDSDEDDEPVIEQRARNRRR